MSSQTGARGASRLRGRGQPRADSEPRSDSERNDANTDRKRASEKSSFSIRGGAVARGNPFTKAGLGAARSQAGQKLRGAEQQKSLSSSRGGAHGGRADGSSRGGNRPQAAVNSEDGDKRSKGAGIQGHFVEYLRGGSTSKGRGGVRASTRGEQGSKGGSKVQNDQVPLSSTSSSSSLAAMGSVVQAWRDPRRAGNGSYVHAMAEFFQTIKKNREQERRSAIQNGTMSDPDKPTSLANAITPVGTCQDMCPEYERVERIVQNMVDGCEKVENDSGTSKVPYENHMVKRFRRSAAGYDEQLPSDIRPPLVLKKTLDYLIEEIVNGREDLKNVHKFVWDRTRGIRNDFSIQQVTKKEDILIAVDCFERIARFHILALHLLSRPGNDEFDHHQEREQLNNTLLSLMYYYDDNKKKMTFPNEAEFRSYCIVSEIQDQRPDLEDRMQNWDVRLLKHPRIKNALKIYAAAVDVASEQGPLRPRIPFTIAQANYGRFFETVDSNATSYLLACVAEMYFNLVRANALETIVGAYRRVSSKNRTKASEDLILEDLEEFLGLDNEEQIVKFCEEHGFTIGVTEKGQYFLDLSSVDGDGLIDSNPRRKQIFSDEIVEWKRHDRSKAAIINGLTVAQARAKAQLDGTSSREVSASEGEQDEYSAEEDSSEDDSKHKAQSTNSTQAISQKPATPTMSTFGNPFSQTTTATSSFATSAIRNPFDTAITPANSSKALEATSDEKANPFLLSSKITPQNGSSGLSPFTSISTKKFDSFAVNPLASNLPTFSAAMQQFNTPPPAPIFDFGSLKRPTTEQATPASTPPFQTTGSPFAAIDKSTLPPLNPSFNFGDLLKKASQSATPSAAQPPPILNQPLTPATTPGSVASTQNTVRGAAKAPLFDTATPASTPLRAKSPPTITSSVELSQGQGLSTFNTPPTKISFQSAVGKGQSTAPPASTAIPGLFHSASIAGPSSLISSIDRQKEAQDQLIDQLARDLMHEGENSYMEQFLEHMIGGIVKESMEIVQDEENARFVEQHRTWHLSRKYGRMWRKITWDRYLMRQHEAKKKRLAEMRKAAVEERAKRERAAARKVSPHWIMLGTEKEQPRDQVAPSSNQLGRKISKARHSNPSSSPHNPTTSISSNLSSSGKKRKQVGEESDESDELDQSSGARNPKRPHTMSSSGFNFVNSGHSSQKDPTVQSWKKRAEMEKSMLEVRRFGPVTKTDTTNSVYFKMIAMGMDPNTPIVPLTKKDIAEAEQKAALHAALDPNHLLNDSTQSLSQSSAQNLTSNHHSAPHFPKPTSENVLAVANHQFSAEHSMGPPQTPMKRPASVNGLSRARYSPEEQALFEKAARIKAELDDGSQWFREELEKARRSTSSRSSSTSRTPGNILGQNRIHRDTPLKRSMGPNSPAHTIDNTTNGEQKDTPASDPKSPAYWRSRISKIYKPDEKADEAKRRKYGVLLRETAAQKRLREFNAHSPSRTRVRQANNGGKDAWLKQSAYGKEKAAGGKGKGKGRAEDWGEMEYVDAEMSDGDDRGEDAEMTDPSEEEEEEGDWDGQEGANGGIGFAAAGHHGFAGSSTQNMGMGAGTGASADDAIEL